MITCFTNCGRYEYPQNPGADCDPDSHLNCKYWKYFCCYAPARSSIYDGMCTTDAKCNQAAGCWHLPEPAGSFCACRAFIKDETCDAEVCTHPNPPDISSQSPFGHCTDVTDDPTACIGDDTVHKVFPGGYTWPNDPQVYGSDARAYRVTFAPGWTEELAQKAPITKFAGALLSPECTTKEDCPFIPGSDPPAHEGCFTPLGRCVGWPCLIDDGGPVSTGTILCRWPEAEPSPTPTVQIASTPPPTSGKDNDRRSWPSAARSRQTQPA